MKQRLLIIYIILSNVISAKAQVRCEAYMPAFSIDIDANAGILSQQAKLAPISTAYPNTVNSFFGNVKINTATATSMDIRFCYNADPGRQFGIATGIIFNKQESNVSLDTFHVEFSAYDFKGNVFRQLITATSPISESITMTSIKIPLLLTWRKDFTKQSIYAPAQLNMFLTVEAGVVYDLQLDDTWNTNADFNYEAIYEFTGGGNNAGTVYDNGTTPNPNDLIITQSQYLKNNPNGNVNNYFAQKNAAGLNVGLNQTPKNSSGNFTLAKGTLGYMADAAMNFKISKKVFFKLGAYFISQSFTNTAQNNSLPLTSKILRGSNGEDAGVDYNSLMNSVSSVKTFEYGITIGLKFFISSHSLLDFQ